MRDGRSRTGYAVGTGATPSGTVDDDARSARVGRQTGHRRRGRTRTEQRVTRAVLVHLAERTPAMTPEQMVAALVPPPQFSRTRFSNYRPDPEHPSQRIALERAMAFAGVRPGDAHPRRRRGLGALLGARAPRTRPGLYLDGGFGVGKTHLLASVWHAFDGRKRFGTFIEYTALVGALGYTGAVRELSGTELIAIDEFELDDPGDTMVISRLLGELVSTGTRVAATSNTPPNALGEGRFAARDFLREITKLAEVFETVRIDGTDYRRRASQEHALVVDDAALHARVDDVAASGGTISIDRFDDLVAHLAEVHPSKYAGLVDGLDAVGIEAVHALDDQTDALRFVAFIDRVYDAELPVIASGIPLDAMFGAGMLEGGYRKKYLRCASRAVAATRAGLPEGEAEGGAPDEDGSAALHAGTQHGMRAPRIVQ